jgi:KaiC/GvpD/RAD55 family RecA-like ATPase
MVNLKDAFSSNQTSLLIMSSVEYNDVLVDVVRQLSGNICYVTTNKTFDSLKEVFEKSKVDIKNIVFIDAISKTMKKVPDQAESVYYVSSPGALTELSLVLGKFLRHEFDYLVFDSITNLLVYQKSQMASKFMTSLINKIKKTKTKAVFYGIKGESNLSIIEHTGTVVDKAIDMSMI